MSYQVLARKWRPRNFEEMVGQEHVLRALIHALDENRLHHAFLFTGTRGVGKTTIARILAKSLNCEQGISSHPCGQCSTCQEIDEGRFIDLIEVDAASRTKVDETRDLLDNVQYAPTRGRYKVYLIDEVHMFSNHSFNALLKTLEEPPPHVKFLLATTDPQKLPVTILSRCLQFNLRRLPLDRIQSHLSDILQKENINGDAAALNMLAQAADGSMRDALSLMDQAIAYGGGKVTDTDVRAMLGSIEQKFLYQILESLQAGDAAAVMQCIQNLSAQAPDYADVLSGLLSMLHALALLQQIPDIYDASMGNEASLRALAQSMSPEDIQLYYQIGLVGRRDLPLAPEPRSGLEMVLLRMLAFRPEGDSTPVRTTPASTVAKVTSQTAAVQKPVAEPASSTPVDNHVDNKQEQTIEKHTLDQPQETSVDNRAEGKNEWHQIVAALNLGGILRQLAAQSVMTHCDNTNIHLCVAPGNAPLLTSEREAQMQEALSAYFGHPVKLKIEVQEHDGETPALRDERTQQARQTNAEVAIEHDEHVRSLIETFDGKVRPNSVRPID